MEILFEIFRDAVSADSAMCVSIAHGDVRIVGVITHIYMIDSLPVLRLVAFNHMPRFKF